MSRLRFSRYTLSHNRRFMLWKASLRDSHWSHLLVWENVFALAETRWLPDFSNDQRRSPRWPCIEFRNSKTWNWNFSDSITELCVSCWHIRYQIQQITSIIPDPRFSDKSYREVLDTVILDSWQTLIIISYGSNQRDSVPSSYQSELSQ